MTFLGKGWKTLTGAVLWGLAHVGIISTVLGVVGIPGTAVERVVALVGQALAVVGLAHKVNRFDVQAFLDALLAALEKYTGLSAKSAPGP